jgi:hypothetical protein
MTFAGSVLPQVSGAIESFTGARSGCYPALVAISRKTDNNKDGVPEDDSSHHEVIRRGSTAPLPKYVIDSSSEDGLQPEAVIGDISFDDVIFSYPTRQEVNVLNGFSLEIKAGQTVAICGPRYKRCLSSNTDTITEAILQTFYCLVIVQWGWQINSSPVTRALLRSILGVDQFGRK